MAYVGVRNFCAKIHLLTETLSCGLLSWRAGKSSPVLPAASHSFIPSAAGYETFLPQIQDLFKQGNSLKKTITVF